MAKNKTASVFGGLLLHLHCQCFAWILSACIVASAGTGFAVGDPWFNGGIGAGWPNAAGMTGVWSSSDSKVALENLATLTAENHLAVEATDARLVFTPTADSDGAGVTVRSELTFTACEAPFFPEIPDPCKGSICLGYTETDDSLTSSYYGVKKVGDANQWVRLTGVAPVEGQVALAISIKGEDDKVYVRYVIDENILTDGESSDGWLEIIPGAGGATVSRAGYNGLGDVASLGGAPLTEPSAATPAVSSHEATVDWKSATITGTVINVPDGATVKFLYGATESVLVNEVAVTPDASGAFTVALSELLQETLYYYSLVVRTNGVDEILRTIPAAFKTTQIPPALDGALNVSPDRMSVLVSGKVTTPSSADVHFLCGTVQGYLDEMKVVPAVIQGAPGFQFEVTDLEPCATYYYELVVSNKWSLGRGEVTSGTFTLTNLILPTGDETGVQDRTRIQNRIDTALREAKVAGEAPGMLELADGQFYVNSQLMVTGGVELVGQGWTNTVVKYVGSSGANARVATVSGGSTLASVTVTGGNASSAGGGILLMGSTLRWCCVTNNVSTGSNGGGVAINTLGASPNFVPSLIDTCLIAGNTAKYGAGVFNQSSGNVTILNTTVAGNAANQSGAAGGLYSSQANLYLTNDIFAVNSAASISDAEKSRIFVDVGFNNATTKEAISGRSANCLFGVEAEVLGAGSGSKFIPADIEGTAADYLFVDAVKGDYHLKAGTVACDLGQWYDGIIVDLDGVERDAPYSDVGCFEVPNEVVFTKPVVAFPSSTKVSVRTTLERIGDEATAAAVYFACSTNKNDLGASVLLKGDAKVEENLKWERTSLEPDTTYYYCFYATNNANPSASTAYKGSFTSPARIPLTILQGQVTAVSAKHATASVRVFELGEGATEATVTVAWGADAAHLCDPVTIGTVIEKGKVCSYELTGLTPLTTYLVRFTATNDLEPDAETKTIDVTYVSPDLEHLTFGRPQISVTETSATISSLIETLGEDATKASVTFRYGTDPANLANSIVVATAAAKGETVSATLSGLTENTVYYFSFEGENDSPIASVQEGSLTGSFVTADPTVYGVYSDYPTELEDGQVVTFVAADTENPYHVVSASLYPWEYVSTSMKTNFYYRNESDYMANASAIIDDHFYLFVADAVKAAQPSNLIEVIRDNNMVATTMEVAIPLTIEGNGHTIKVKEPFVDESGYINTNCTVSPKNLFWVKNGGDLFLRNMTIMSGGEHLDESSPGVNNVTTPAIIVGKENKNLYQSGSNGILQMEDVTVTRSQGALYTAPGTHTYINRCQLVRNCRYCGGGMYSFGFLVMENSSLSENRSLYSVGGGGAAENMGEMYINNCVICNNASTEIGGALNNYSGKYPIELYLVNSTVAGNFTTRNVSDGGGIGLRNSSGKGGEFYAVNNIICSNFHYNKKNDTLTRSDIRVVGGGTVNGLYYNVYGEMSGVASTTTMEGNMTVNWQDWEDDGVFLDYYSMTRVYEHEKDTMIELAGTPRLYSDLSEPLARYAPLRPDGNGVMGEEGVTTYFDASGWRTGVVYVAYKTATGELTALGNAPLADADDLVTTFYESEIVPDTIERTIGIAGASAWTPKDVDVPHYTLRLKENPQNGKVGNISLYGDTYATGTVVTVTASPNEGYAFDGWYDKAGNLVSVSSVYQVLMDSDKTLMAKFKIAETVTLKVRCEQTLGEHKDFALKIETNWLAQAFSTLCPDGEVTEENHDYIVAALNAPDDVNGLNHKWMNYVVGIQPGDQAGRIWINSTQTDDAGTIRFRTEPLAPVKGCGFTVKYRLDSKLTGKGWERTGLENQDKDSISGKFDMIASANANGHYVIDLIFIPAGKVSSEEYVTTVNTGAIVKVESAKKVEILATPWSGFSPTDNPAVSAAEYVKAASLTPGDRIYVYNRLTNGDGSAVRDAQGRWLGYYEVWKVGLDGATWQPIAVFHLDENGTIAATDQNPASAVTVPRGAGVWLERQDATKPIYLYGQLDTTPVKTKLERGWNLVGAPTGEAFDASRLTPVNAAKDHLVIPTGGAPLNCTYDTTAGNWGYITNQTVSIVGHNFIRTTRTTEGLTVPAGLGFWYVNEGDKEADLEWQPQTGPEEVQQ